MNAAETIQEYQILQSASPAEIQGMVNAKIREGWQPWGVLLYNDMLFVQVVVKQSSHEESINYDQKL